MTADVQHHLLSLLQALQGPVASGQQHETSTRQRAFLSTRVKQDGRDGDCQPELPFDDMMKTPRRLKTPLPQPWKVETLIAICVLGESPMSFFVAQTTDKVYSKHKPFKLGKTS